MGELYLGVLLNDRLRRRTQNDVKIQNSPDGAVGESRRGLEGYI